MGKDRRSNLSLTQMAAVVGMVLAAYLLVDLALMVWDIVLLRGMVAEQERRQAQLEADVEWIESVTVGFEEGRYLEEWAREEGRLVQEGDVLIIVDPPVADSSGSGLLSKLQVVKPAPEQPHWREWWDVFFSP